VPSARRWSVSDGRKLVSVVLVIVAAFTVCASVGAQSWLIAALGVALFAAAIAFYVVSALNSREFAYVPGTAHVVSSSPPPAAASQGRCEMHLVVHAPGMDDVAVKIRDAGVPVSKWPDAGGTLPILVAVGDPRRVRVLWDSVRSHGDVADTREDADYQGESVEESYLDDLLDDEYDDATPLADLDPDARVIELDVMDPTLFRSEPAMDLGPGLSPGIQLDPDTALAPETELSPDIDFAGPDEDLEPAPPQPRRRPSPRPRRPLDDQAPLPDLEMEPTGGVTTLPHQPTPADRDGEPVPLQVTHVVPADPAVAAMPSSDPDEDVSEAYLAVTPPPGQAPPRTGGRIRGVSVTLFVANLGRSVAFYRDLLGFRQVDMGIGSAVLESGDGRIVLRRVVDMAPVDRRLVHLLLEVPDVQAAYDDLLTQGVEFVHRPRAVSRYEQLELLSAAFRDPDGHGIALVRWDVRH
jgi:catechol 2,3-dioxygenase-like lactoylglutathione lyase family enzyme